MSVTPTYDVEIEEEIVRTRCPRPASPVPPAPRGRGEAVKSGAAAGLLAGLVLSVFMAVMNAAKGQDIWAGVKAAGIPFLKEAAMRPGFEFGSVLVGFLSHLAVSAIWGILFGWIIFGRSKAVTIIGGALWGVVVWLGMFYAVLPLVGLGSMVGQIPVGAAIAEHMFFGLVLGLSFLPFQQPKS